jgi:UDP-3-O-[3-hydroxymyristoyl] glucosamine N-acyltransferase
VPLVTPAQILERISGQSIRLKDLNYNILYDNGKILCFAGLCRLSVTTYNMLRDHMTCEVCSVEDLQNKDADWFEQRQFIVISSDITFKMSTVDFLVKQQAHFFTLVSKFNSISPDVKIGVGTYIGPFNTFEVDEITIGNHCVICTHNTVGHNVQINDHCHVSHYIFVNHCVLGQGTIVGTQVLITPSNHNETIIIPPYCNITSNSRIVQSLESTGTYHGRRLMTKSDSRTNRIL